jgi:hypothetical protein
MDMDRDTDTNVATGRIVHRPFAWAYSLISFLTNQKDFTYFVRLHYPAELSRMLNAAVLGALNTIMALI